MSETTLDAAQVERVNREVASKMDRFAEAYRANADLRARAEAAPRTVLAENGLDELAMPRGADVRIVADTEDTIHFMLPPDPNEELAEDDLVGVSGGVFSREVWELHGGSCYVAHGSTRGGTSSGW